MGELRCRFGYLTGEKTRQTGVFGGDCITGRTQFSRGLLAFVHDDFIVQLACCEQESFRWIERDGARQDHRRLLFHLCQLPGGSG